MTAKEKIIEQLREQQPYLSREYGVKRIGLFGSVAKDTASSSSDVDLIIEFNRPVGFRFMELGDYLEKLLGRKVDMLTPEGVRGIRVESVRKDIEKDIVYV